MLKSLCALQNPETTMGRQSTLSSLFPAKVYYLKCTIGLDLKFGKKDVLIFSAIC